MLLILLKKVAKTKRALFIKFDPSLILKSYLIGENVEENINTLKTIEILQKCGAEWTGRTQNISQSIQPRYQANVYTKENIINTFPKHTKRLIKDSDKRGVQTYRGTIDDLKAFSNVIALTESRKGVSLRNEEYFRKLMKIYGNDAYLHLAKS